MNLTQLQAVVAPIATPAAPAIIIGMQAYLSMIASGSPQTLAVAGAVLSGVGMEVGMALMLTVMMIAIRRRAWFVVFAACVGILAYVSFAMIGVGGAINGGAFYSYIGMSIVCCAGPGMLEYLKDGQQQQTAHLDAVRAETARIEAETKRIRAEAKAARVSTTAHSVDSLPTNAPTNGQPSLQQRVIDFYAVHPSTSTRDAAAALNCSKSIVARYMPVDSRPIP